MRRITGSIGMLAALIAAFGPDIGTSYNSTNVVVLPPSSGWVSVASTGLLLAGGLAALSRARARVRQLARG